MKDIQPPIKEERYLKVTVGVVPCPIWNIKNYAALKYWESIFIIYWVAKNIWTAF